MPFLYILGWILAKSLLILSNKIDQSDISLIGTLVTFILFLFIMPDWIRVRWKNYKPFESLGFTNNLTYNIFFFIRGLLISFLLIIIVLLPFFFGGWILGVSTIKLEPLMNAIFLGIGVGFAEEVVFRGWLLGEMNFLIGNRLGIFIQAAIFSLCHMRLSMDLKASFILLFSLFLLGLLLGIRRKLDSGSLYGSIALHGGLVGGWFLIDHGLINISSQTPYWIKGPGELSPNPIGSIAAILVMSLILFYQRKALTRF